MKKGCKSCFRVISNLERTLQQQRVQLDGMPRPGRIRSWIPRSCPTPVPRVRSLGSRWKVHRSAKTMIPGGRYTDARSQLGLCCWAKCQLHPQLGRSLRKFVEQKPKPWPKGNLKPNLKPKRKTRSRTCRIELPLFVMRADFVC